MNNLYLLLQQCSLFKNKTHDEIEQLLSEINYRIASYKKDAIVFSPFQKATTLGIILSGSVDVIKNFPSGKTLLINRCGPSNLIAEDSIFSSLDDYPETFLISSPSKILLIHSSELLKLLYNHNDLLLNFLIAVSDSTIILKKCTGVLSLDSIQEKIAAYLYHEYQRTNTFIISLPFSKKDWSEHLNLSRTSLSRELRELENLKIITFNSRVITITDFEQLKKLLHL